MRDKDTTATHIIDRVARLEAALERLASYIEAHTDGRKEFLSQKEVCSLLQMSRTRLFLMRRGGTFPAPDIEGKRPRWRRGTIEAWIRSRKDI